MISSPPVKPVLIYDGDCGFCLRWIERWKKKTGDRLDYRASQGLSPDEFLEIPRAQYQKSIVLILSDGRSFTGAKAALQSLASFSNSKAYSFLNRSYDFFLPFAWLAEAGYALVAGHRAFFSHLGKGQVLPTQKSYSKTRTWFLRALGLVYCSAFISAAVQVTGLIGSHGILPAQETLNAYVSRFGVERFWILPTVNWLGASNGMLIGQCIAGALLGLLVIIGKGRRFALLACWALYLSLLSVGNVFFRFQWDSLLLETGLLAFFLSWDKSKSEKEPSRLWIWLGRWLLFRLMFASGMVKLLSGDPVWQNGTALLFHYETQPLPTWLAWHAHHLPEVFQRFCGTMVFVFEIGAPLFFFGPRKARITAGLATAFLMIIIMITGNYCFFNLLTMALCILLLDDDCFSKKKMPAISHCGISPKANARAWWMPAGYVMATLTFCITLMNFSDQMRLEVRWPSPLRDLRAAAGPWVSFNHYGLFADMTTTRFEIVLEGSEDGETWKPYEFRYKPGELTRRPAFNVPHQPRLDWQMWFAALSDIRNNPWLLRFVQELLEGNPEAERLLKINPFPSAPPRFIRGRLYQYYFSDPATQKSTGQWWTREERGLYFPPARLT